MNTSVNGLGNDPLTRFEQQGADRQVLAFNVHFICTHPQPEEVTHVRVDL